MSETGRYRFLDLLRGIAVLGILPVNIPFMALPMMADTPGEVTAADRWAVHLTQGFAYLKFISIFSLLFGVGLALMRSRAEESGRPWKARGVRRLAALWLIGSLHVLLVWYGDILVWYAIIGLVWMWASSWTPRTLTVVGLILLGVPILLLAAATPIAWALEQDPVFAEEFVADNQGAATAETLATWSARATRLVVAIRNVNPRLASSDFLARTFRILRT